MVCWWKVSHNLCWHRHGQGNYTSLQRTMSYWVQQSSAFTWDLRSVLLCLEGWHKGVWNNLHWAQCNYHKGNWYPPWSMSPWKPLLGYHCFITCLSQHNCCQSPYWDVTCTSRSPLFVFTLSLDQEHTLSTCKGCLLGNQHGANFLPQLTSRLSPLPLSTWTLQVPWTPAQYKAITTILWLLMTTHATNGSISWQERMELTPASRLSMHLSQHTTVQWNPLSGMLMGESSVQQSSLNSWLKKGYFISLQCHTHHNKMALPNVHSNWSCPSNVTGSWHVCC